MLLARVVGRVNAARRIEALEPHRLLVVRTERTGRHYVAVDTHGAVPGELVVTTSAAAARMCERLEGVPVDLCVVAVLDDVEVPAA
jgi:ethanolamine utilization protein EutN